MPELVPVGGREMGGLVEPDRSLGILVEHAVDDTAVEVKVSVQARADGSADLAVVRILAIQRYVHVPKGISGFLRPSA